VLIQCFADGEKAYFQKEFAAAQEEMERQKKVLRDAKKVDTNTFRAKTNLIDEFFVRLGNGIQKRSDEMRFLYLVW
jgi:phage tail tape-measure protein